MRAENREMKKKVNTVDQLREENKEIKEENRILKDNFNKSQEDNKDKERQNKKLKEEKIRLAGKYIDALFLVLSQIGDPNSEKTKTIDEAIQLTNLKIKSLDGEVEILKKKLTEKLDKNYSKLVFLNDQIRFLENLLSKEKKIKDLDLLEKKSLAKNIVNQIGYYINELNYLQSELNPEYERQYSITQDPKISRILNSFNIPNTIHPPISFN